MARFQRVAGHKSVRTGPRSLSCLCVYTTIETQRRTFPAESTFHSLLVVRAIKVGGPGSRNVIWFEGKRSIRRKIRPGRTLAPASLTSLICCEELFFDAVELLVSDVHPKFATF